MPISNDLVDFGVQIDSIHCLQNNRTRFDDVTYGLYGVEANRHVDHDSVLCVHIPFQIQEHMQ